MVPGVRVTTTVISEGGAEAGVGMAIRAGMVSLNLMATVLVCYRALPDQKKVKS